MKNRFNQWPVMLCLASMTVPAVSVAADAASSDDPSAVLTRSELRARVESYVDRASEGGARRGRITRSGRSGDPSGSGEGCAIDMAISETHGGRQTILPTRGLWPAEPAPQLQLAGVLPPARARICWRAEARVDLPVFTLVSRA